MRPFARAALASCALAAVIAGAAAARAAELPVKAPMTPAVANWAGLYLGGNVGYSWGDATVDYTQAAGAAGDFGTPFAAAGFSRSVGLAPDSLIGGVQIGYLWQQGVFVVGGEADIAWRNASDSYSEVFPTFSDRLTLFDRQDWIGTLRLRLGFAPPGPALANTLVYFTGGLAYGGFRHSVTQFCNLGCGLTRTISESPVRIGWTVGGGIEYAPLAHWSVGLEYLYMDFGTDTLSVPAAAAAPGISFPHANASFHDTSQLVRIKLNYRFE